MAAAKRPGGAARQRAVRGPGAPGARGRTPCARSSSRAAEGSPGWRGCGDARSRRSPSRTASRCCAPSRRTLQGVDGPRPRGRAVRPHAAGAAGRRQPAGEPPGVVGGRPRCGPASEERRLSALTAGDVAIESAFDLSYRHMDGIDERAVPASRARCPPTSFSTEIAAQLLPRDGSGDAVADTESRMDALVDLGMVQPVAGRRYRLHDLVRLFAAARLRDEQSSEERTAQTRRLEDWLLEVGGIRGPALRAGQPCPPRPGTSSSPTASDADRWLRQESAHWFRALQRRRRRGGTAR